MITRDNPNQLFDQLGFTQTGQKHSKTIGEATLTVGWKKGEISYPEAQGLTINERLTCNLSSDENFVVLECVHRLLGKGYKPANIELEPKWKLGHGASGRRPVPASFYETLDIPLPPLTEQRRIVTEVEAEQHTIAAAPARKQAILERYL